ncbi:hypothetical protein X801_10403, partial [Opisthorchis viverrini]
MDDRDYDFQLSTLVYSKVPPYMIRSSSIQIKKKAIMVNPIAIFGESTENVFNENYFVVFDEAKLPSAGWASSSEWTDRLNKSFYVGEYLFGIKSWQITNTAALQTTFDISKNLKPVLVSVIPVTVRMSNEEPSLDELSDAFKAANWKISKDGQVKVGMRATLDLIEENLIYGRVFDAESGKVQEVTAQFTMRGLSLQSADLEGIKVVKCEEHLNAYSLKASFEFFIPVGSQRLPAKNLPKAHSTEYANIIEFSEIFLREDLLRELQLHTAVLAVHVSDLVVSDSHIMACGSVNFNTIELLNIQTDLDQDDLVGSFNDKFEGEKILKLQ